jgi:hypothetical protein
MEGWEEEDRDLLPSHRLLLHWQDLEVDLRLPLEEDTLQNILPSTDDLLMRITTLLKLSMTWSMKCTLQLPSEGEQEVIFPIFS